VVDTAVREGEVLINIVQLDMPKIRMYVQNLRKSEVITSGTMSDLKARLIKELSSNNLVALHDFLSWFDKFYYFHTLQSDSENEERSILLKYVMWAQKAKKVYRNYLRAAFSRGDQTLPRWVYIIFKLGRYGVAAKALVQTASELPQLFNPISVEALNAPPKSRFTLQDTDLPLTCVLRRLGEIKPDEMVPRLASIWNHHDAETYFRKSCSVDLTTHAELQMISFYDHNPQLMPRLRFIGVSKKACYLCLQFLTAHPEAFSVSSCHQKIYLSWIPPPATTAKIYKGYKAITTDMSKKMEAIARQDLITRFGLRRYPVPADSTAGVSLSGLTESKSLEVTASEDLDYIEIDPVGFTDNEGLPDTGPSRYAAPDKVTDSSTSTRSVSPAYSIPSSQKIGAGEANFRRSGPEIPWQINQASLSSMVFYFPYLRGDRQDIIMLGTVLDPHTSSPSWSKLLELLNQDLSFGPVFRDSDFMIVNDQIRVHNERQFVACVQYLFNSRVSNSEVKICDESSIPQTTKRQNES